jgi:hypothetical protein
MLRKTLIIALVSMLCFAAQGGGPFDDAEASATVGITSPAFLANFPKDMPKVRLPQIVGGCNKGEIDEINDAWTLAHYYMWRSYQVLDYINDAPESDRADLWNDGYDKKWQEIGQYSKNWSPRAWFGPYDKKRFQIVYGGIKKVWQERFLDKTFKIECRTSKDESGPHPCFVKDPYTGNTPSANHIVYGKINLCANFLDMSKKSQAKGLIHEIYHWLDLPNSAFWVSDLHTHCDKKTNIGTCLDCTSEKMYGDIKATHLATTSICNHYDLAYRNNDNYAWFIYSLGQATQNGDLMKFPTKSDDIYLGVWRSGNDGYYLWQANDWQGFNDKWEELTAKKYRLIDFETYIESGKRRYVGVWREGDDRYGFYAGLDWQSFDAKWKELGKKDLRLIDIETYEDGGKRKYAGVWRDGSDSQALWVGLDWQDFEQKWQQLAKDDLRLIDIEIYVDGGKRKFAGVWRKADYPYALWVGSSWQDFTDKWKTYADENLRLIDIETYTDGDKRLYAGVWRGGSDGYYLWHVSDWKAFTEKWEELGKSNLRLIDMEIRLPSGRMPIYFE